MPGTYAVLEHEGWLAWNEEQWGLRPERLSFGDSEPTAARLNAVLYITKAGAVRMPSRNPYLPIGFYPSSSTRSDRVGQQWITLAQEFAEHIRDRGLIGSIALPPGYLDARPFQWAGFETTVRYTFVERLPWSVADAGASVRKRVRKAHSLGYTVAPSTDWHGLHRCLTATEDAKSFTHKTSPRELQRLHELLGPERLSAFAVLDATGDMVSASLRLHEAGSAVVDWSAGTHRRALTDGVVQLVYEAALEEAYATGATHFDFVGANIPPVAAAKATWGFRLVPYLVISAPGLRSAVRTALRGWRWRRRAVKP